ncbi:MAG: hypothetical protein JWL86_7047, partial [Rhizobium sp.]|nr:hypothetical protein [Rhizobium sp.]
MDHEIREPGRVAVPSIRGYWYQILHTVRAWLQAGDDRLIVAEGNEDIDHVLLTTPPTVLEEQVKFRSKTVSQGDEAIEMTALRYLDAFVHHRAWGGGFRGILRTNAAIAAADDTQVGKWILGKRVNVRAFLREIRR